MPPWHTSVISRPQRGVCDMVGSIRLLQSGVRVFKKKKEKGKGVTRDSKKYKGMYSYTTIITLLSSGPIPRDSACKTKKMIPHDSKEKLIC